MSNSILDNMPPAEREALLSKLRDLLAPKAKTIRDVPAPDLRFYYLVSNGILATAIDGRDAPNETEAIRVARTDKLQPWYLARDVMPEQLQISKLNHNQYVDWLRRHN